jgi:hypothetical protein
MKTASKILPITGFVLLIAMVMVLLLAATNAAWISHPAAGILAVFITIGTIIAIFYEGKMLISQDIPAVPISRKVFEFSAVVIGGLITFYFSHDIGMGVVIASSVVGILAAMVAPEYSVAAYCGSFVGMSSNNLFFNYSEVIFASVVAGLVYVLTRDLFAGFGGKLGTIAFIGATIAAFMLGREFMLAPIPDWHTNFWIFLAAFIAAPLTFYLNCYLDNGPVLASGIVGLLGGLMLPSFFPQIGNLLAIVVFCASFTGMSNTKRCPKFWHMLVAGTFTGVLFIFTTPLLGGAGGKLGTIAFASIIATDGFIELYRVSQGKDAIYNTD